MRYKSLYAYTRSSSSDTSKIQATIQSGESGARRNSATRDGQLSIGGAALLNVRKPRLSRKQRFACADGRHAPGSLVWQCWCILCTTPCCARSAKTSGGLDVGELLTDRLPTEAFLAHSSLQRPDYYNDAGQECHSTGAVAD